MENLWHTMADTGESVLRQASEMGATGLVLEWRPGTGPLSGVWNDTFHLLSLYDWEPALAKSGDARQSALATREAVESLCTRASDQGLSTYLMGGELNLSPEMEAGRPDLKDPDGDSLYDLVARRLEDVLTACPHLTGILLYLEESQIVIQDLPGSRPPAERMRLLIESELRVCERLERKLIITTFALMPHQATAVVEALRQIAPSPSLLVHNYVCPGDWGRIVIPNPAVGKCGPHPELVAFDYCGEIWGQSVVPFVQAKLICERVQRARELGATIAGLTGYVTWGDLEGDKVYEGHAIGSINEVNLHVGRRIAETGELEPEKYVREWAEQTYGRGIAEKLTPILLREQDTHLAAWQLLDFWYLEWPKSRLPDANWFEYTLHWESLAIWDESYRETEQLLWNPTREFVENRVLPEKDAAVAAAMRDLEEVESIVNEHWGKASPIAVEELLRFFRRELTTNRALRHHVAAYFYTKLATAGDIRAASEAREQLSRLVAIVNELEANPDPGLWILEPARVRHVVQDMENVLRTQKWPADEAIRKWNQQMLDWGYES